jgi:hypothetical protein
MPLTKALSGRFDRVTAAAHTRVEQAFGSRLEDSYLGNVRGGSYREFELTDGDLTVKFVAVGFRTNGTED